MPSPSPGSRPSLPKRHSSGGSGKYGVVSPGSAGEYQPLRHVKPTRHAKIVLPRNHSSARNLAKLGRQAQANHAVEDGRRRSGQIQKSHEGDSEIRLPGSLDEGEGETRECE